MILPIVLAFIYLLVSTGAQTCSRYPNNLQSSVVNFRQTPGQRQYTSTIPIQFKFPSTGFQVALSLQQLNLQGKDNYNFKLQAIPDFSKSSFTIKLTVEFSNWGDLAVGYLATANTQIVAGSFTIQTFGSSMIGINEYISKLNCYPQGLKNINLQITGLKGTGKKIQTLLIANAYMISVYSNQIGGTIKTDPQAGISEITINYVVYCGFNSVFKISMPGFGYSLMGFVGVNKNLPIFNGIGLFRQIYCCQGLRCDKNEIKVHDCQRGGGTLNQDTCFLCLANELIIKDKCQSTQCGNHQIKINQVCRCQATFVRQNGSCVKKCSINQTFNGYICLCNERYIRVAATRCIKCRDDQQIDKYQTRCHCPEGTKDNNSKCQSICLANSKFNNIHKKCQCNKPYVQINNQCYLCPQNVQPNLAFTRCNCGFRKYFSLKSKQCTQQPTCPYLSRFNQNQQSCSCLYGMLLINGSCGFCGSNRKYIAENQTCSCRSGYIVQQGLTSCSRCPADSFPNKNNDKCICSNGQQVAVWNKCKVCTVPKTYYNFNSSQCLCQQPNQKIVNGKCQGCPDPKMIIEYNQCRCIKSYALIAGKCVQCPYPTKPASDLSSCICIDGFHKINGNTCQQCPGVNTRFNTQSKKCQCKERFYSSKQNSNTCIHIPNNCPNNAHFNQTTEICQCDDPNEIIKNGFCQCLSPYYFSVTSRKCQMIKQDCPSDMLYNTLKQQCQCKDTTATAVSNKCVKCGPNQKINGTQCQCKDSYAKIQGKCTSCGSSAQPNIAKTLCICKQQNQHFSVNTCLCNYNHFRTGKSCIQCPAYSTINAKQDGCICFGNDRFFNGRLCQCNNGNEISSNGQCLNCPQNSRQSKDNKTCQCQRDGQVYDQGLKSCICKQSYFRYGGKCVLCPKTGVVTPDRKTCHCYDSVRVFNGSQCVCTNQSIEVNGQCKLCPANSLPNADKSKCQCKSNNQEYDGKYCVCKKDTVNVNGRCIQCPPFSQINLQERTCRCTLTNQVFDNNKSCICAANYFKIDGKCQKCGFNQQYNAQISACQCVNGTKKSGNQCVGTINCPAQAVFNSITKNCQCTDSNAQFNNHKCLCKKGYFYSLKTNVCKKYLDCLIPDTKFNTDRQQCVCNFIGAIIDLSSSSCKCPDQYYNNTVLKSCHIVPPCDQKYAEFNRTTGNCQCKIKGAKLLRGIKCQCNQGQHIDSSSLSCKSNSNCPVPNTFFDRNQKICKCSDHNAEIVGQTCQCKNSYVLFQGRCATVSRSLCLTRGTIWNLNEDKCQCLDEGAEFKNGKCPCKSGYKIGSTNGKCIKQDQCFNIPASKVNPVNGKCQCIDPYAFVNRNTSRCQCLSDFQMNSKNLCEQKCTLTGTKVNPVTSKCQCTIKGALISLKYNNCSCPVGTRLDSAKNQCVKGKQCKVNEVFNFNSGQCDCQSTFVRINGNCLVCPATSTFLINSKTCLCTNMNEIFSEGNCVCEDGYYRINAICSKCSTNQKMSDDKTKCECIPGTMNSTSGCVGIPTCPPNSTLVNTECKCDDDSAQIRNNQCKCKSGYYQSAIQKKCKVKLSCEFLAFSQFSTSTEKCQCNDKNSQNFNNATCRCKSGYYRNQFRSQCRLLVQCPFKGAVFDQNTQRCICKNKAGSLINNKCVCPANQYVGGPQQICIDMPACTIAGTTFNIETGICQCNIKGALINSGKCQCVRGSYSRNNQCVVIPICRQVGTFYNTSSHQCQCNIEGATIVNLQCLCPQNKVQNKVTNMCEDSNSGACAASQYYSLLRGKCIIQPLCTITWTVFNKKTQKCECNFTNSILYFDSFCSCKTGYSMDNVLKQCKKIPECGFGALPDKVNGACQCDTNSAFLLQFRNKCYCLPGYTSTGQLKNCVLVK